MKELASNKHLIDFLRAFINELLGRYVSLYQFVDRSRREAGGQATALLEEYSNRLNESVIELLQFLPSLYDLPVSDDDVDKDSLTGVFGFLISKSEEFQNTHRTLRWFSEPWPEAELFQFLKRVFKERGLERDFESLNPSIVFHDVYNFLTYDIGYMQHSVNRAELDAWALPKSESSNPLLWTVLVHEVAHDIYGVSTIHDYLRERIDSFPKQESEGISLLDLLNLWSRELTADLFSFYVLGPAYLYSLIYFSVFFVRNDLRTPFLTETTSTEVWEQPKTPLKNLHPPPKDRINLLIDEMSSLKFKHSDEHIACLNKFRDLFNARCEFDNAEDLFESKDAELVELRPNLKTQLWRALKEMQEGQFSDDAALGDRDIRDATSLFQRLKKRELASALPRSKRSLDKVRDYLAGNESAVKRNAALEQLDELPARMIDIINAGWMNKARDPYWKEPICKSGLSDEMLLKWPQFLDPLIESSRQLQKSIQVSLIISSLFEQSEAEQ